MKLKEGVDGSNVHPYVWLWLGALTRVHRGWTGVELVVTSLRRPAGIRPSRHAALYGELVTAADIRRCELDLDEDAEAFCRMLQVRWGRWLGVVLEPEWLTPAELAERGGVENVVPHIHIQLKAVEVPWKL